MAFVFETVAEYTTEIELIRGYMLKGMRAEEFSLNTSQSVQRIQMNLSEMRKYLNQLTAERQSLAERSVGGGGVTSIVVRRSY